jgi:hypothetical protein
MYGHFLSSARGPPVSPSVAVIETSGLGDRSYVAHADEVAVSIDPGATSTGSSG